MGALAAEAHVTPTQMPRLAFLLLASVLIASCGSRDKCPSCEIAVERIATFGDEEGNGALESLPLVSAQFDGRRIVLQPDGSRLLPRLFTSKGRFLSVLGALGEGPGEFASPWRAFTRRDTAWVVDGILRRATAVTADGITTTTTPWHRTANDAIARTDGSWVLAGGEGYIRSMAVASPEGAVLQEFGDTMGTWGTRRHLASAGQHFWSAASLHRLRFEEWAHPDSLVRVIEPVTPHFPPYERVLPATQERPPIRALRGFWTDSLARIWALLEVPGTDWRSGYGEPRLGEDGQFNLQMLDPNRAYRSVILVIDPTTATVVAERTLEGWYYSVVEPFVIVRAVQDADGWYRAELWRVRGALP